jgi:ABC-type dipeptide/oligopeptide/nickel transport system permease subunit
MTELTGASAGVAPAPTRRPGRVARMVRSPRFLLPALLVAIVVALSIAPGVFAGWFGHSDPHACDLTRSAQGPQAGHPFGFDIQGCDLYANVVYGARASIGIGLLTTVGTVGVAVLLGTLAGYYGGAVDLVISRLMDVFFGFPALVGMIVLLSAWNTHTVWSISAMLVLFTWPPLTRVMRASVMATAALTHVQAARSVGVGTLRILTRHVAANSLSPVVVLAGLNVGAIITAEAALTFLGVGLRSPSISWGVQLNEAERYFATDLHLLLFPSLFLSLTVLGFVLLGDVLRDHLDPRFADE